MSTRFVVENCVTLVVTAATVLGLFYMGAGLWSLFGFLLMLNMNETKAKE